jgi:hypothetical protein
MDSIRKSLDSQKSLSKKPSPWLPAGLSPCQTVNLALSEASAQAKLSSVTATLGSVKPEPRVEASSASSEGMVHSGRVWLIPGGTSGGCAALREGVPHSRQHIRRVYGTP